MEAKSNQTIKCDVKNCKYNNDAEYLCTLEKIDISCTCNNELCNDKLKTICNSFKENK